MLVKDKLFLKKMESLSLNGMSMFSDVENQQFLPNIEALFDDTQIWWEVRFLRNSILLGACGIGNVDKENKTAELRFSLVSSLYEDGTLENIFNVLMTELKFEYDFETLYFWPDENENELVDKFLKFGFQILETENTSDKKRLVYSLR